MPASRSSAADSIRILISTDNHVGYNERDGQRGDDSWKTFDEIMCMARERDVDMILLAGDLFHDNKPSRKSMYQVMRSLRENCFGDKPCELQMLSDGSEHFAGAFNHVNYQDQDINVAIPVFSIHGNHDDPSGEGHLAALDILAMAGLLNYYGRTPESDNIEVKPLLLRKGRTQLALYGLSNVRDERLFRTFRAGKVKFFQPNEASGDWFNIMSVHQNHHAYTDTSYLPEDYLPEFVDLVIWGHEHECKIDPIHNPERGFDVMQPGSSVATSLVKGEAVPKQVAIVTVTGTDYSVEPIRLRTVRPFVVKEIVLKDYEEMRKVAHMPDNRTRVTAFLDSQVNELIEQAKLEFFEAQEQAGVTDLSDTPVPLPLIRLRVECTAPDGGKFEVDNPQRFSVRFAGRVANCNDVVQYHRKRTTVRTSKMQPDMPEEHVMAQITIDSVQVDKLVKEFLTAQSLAILPQNRFSDAVGQFVDKDDKNAVGDFLKDSLKRQVETLAGNDQGAGRDDDEEVESEDDEEWLADGRIEEAMENLRMQLEEKHARGELKSRQKKRKLRPRPNGWDSDENGPWEESIGARPVEEEGEAEMQDDDDASVASGSRPLRGKGSRGGRVKGATGTTRKAAATTKQAPAKTTGGRSKKPVSEDEDEDDDVIMLDDDEDEEESQGLFVSQAKSTTSRSRTQRNGSPTPSMLPPKKATARGKAGASAAPTGRQSQLNFGGTRPSSTARTNGTGRAAASKPTSSRRMEPSDDDISDDDAFEPPPPAQRARNARR